MLQREFSLALLAGALIAGCASTACVPATVVVERKDERRALGSEVRGLRTTATGTVVEDRRQVIVSEYWILARDGRWYRLTEGEWQTAEVGQPLSLCR